jgi:hypothetical protein
MSLQKRGRRSHSGPNTLAPPVRTSPAHVLGPLAKHEATGPLTRPVNLGCYQQVSREKRLRTGCPVTKRAPSRMAGLSLSVEPRARVTSYWARAFHKRLRSEEHPPGRVPPAARTGARRGGTQLAQEEEDPLDPGGRKSHGARIACPGDGRPAGTVPPEAAPLRVEQRRVCRH